MVYRGNFFKSVSEKVIKLWSAVAAQYISFTEVVFHS